ncbi:MAG: hypothetical protein HC942_22345 [Microcoleus sp. SU_5_6]|nr:hypothetical protein [Microcoleus sp. SU_5_6]
MSLTNPEENQENWARSEPSRSHLLPILKLISLSAAAGAIAAGFLVLAGWKFDIAVFKTGLTSTATMKANTALCFILSGASLGLLHWRSPAADKKN